MINKNPLVSIVTPSYNQAEYITETLNSVSAQDYENIEHIVQDGESNDGTVKILTGRDVDWVSEPDDGQADAINTAFDSASGDIIGWLNSDDVYFATDIISQVVNIFAQTDADIIYGDYAVIDDVSRVLAIRCLPDFDFGRLRRGCFITQPSVFFRRDVILEHKLDPSLEYGMDYEFWLRLAVDGFNFQHIPRVFSGDRNYAERKIRQDRTAMVAESESIQVQYGREAGVRHFANRLFDIVASGVPRRLNGAVRGAHIARKQPNTAFNSEFLPPVATFRNAFVPDHKLL